MGRGKEIAALTNKAALRQYRYDLETYAAQKADLQREVDLTNKVNQETFKYQQELRNIERLSILDQYNKSQDQYKQQLVWNDQAANAAVESQNRIFDQRVLEIKETAENQKTQLKRTNITAGYNLDQAEFTLEQALYNADQQKEQIELDYKNQILAIEGEESNITKAQDQIAIQRIQIENKERDAVADRNFEQLAADVQLIEAQGQQLAQGRSGKSASASLQSSVAAFAINTAKINDALYRSKESLKQEKASVEAESSALSREIGFSAQRRDYAKEGRDLGIGQAAKSKEFASTKAKLDIDKLAQELDLDVKIFQENQAKLGASLVAAAEQRRFAMSEIARGKVQADIQADAQRMLPPRFAPDPPRPYKAEMPTLVPPPEPVRATREAYQVPQPKKQSGLSKILAIGGAILGIAGAAFTGGASLFAGGAAATLGTVGTVATAGGTGLGLISQYT